MKWEKVKLGKYVEILSGFAFKSKDFLNCGVPVIKIKNITQEGVTLEDVSYISKELADKNEKYHLNYNDILIALTGSHINQMSSVVGRIARIKYHEDSLLNQRVGKVFAKDSKLCDIDYVYYFLSQDYIKISLASKAGGAANQANISPNDVKSLTVRWPDIETQHRIADILSAYDDLIENNQKQIKLLEEAAQRLYKEWFEDLRFPGYENTKIVDGVPEGWQWCKVRDVADINSSALPKNYKEDFIEYVDLVSVRCGHIETRTRYNLNEAPGRAKRCAKDGDIIWGMVRPNLKAYALVTNPKETDVFSTGFAVLSAKKVPYSYLYCAVTQEEFVGYLVNATNGAAYPAVKPVHFEVADILKPDDKVLEQFHSVADSIYRKKEALENQNHNLRESRDLILPKLMSGDLEV